MKKSIIKTISILLLLITAVLLISIVSLYINKEKQFNYSLIASNNANEYLTQSDEANLLNNINTIEGELAKNGNNVIDLLIQQKNDYEKALLNVENSEETLKIKTLIKTTDDIINEFKIYNNSKRMRAPYHALYTPAVGAVIAYFNSKHYKLSAELLTHAKENNVTDSYYDPVYKNIITSSKIFKNIALGKEINGTEIFPIDGDNIDMDLGYAIHGFSYYKSMPKTRTVTITDRYDFAKGDRYDGIAGTAVDTMYKAMKAGAIVPFKMAMSLTLYQEGSVGSTYTSYVYLGKGESLDFYLLLKLDSNYNIKMLLNKNVKFEVYDNGLVDNNIPFDSGEELTISPPTCKSIRLRITNITDKNATYFLIINPIK